MITEISDVLGHQTEMGQLKIRLSERGPLELMLILRCSRARSGSGRSSVNDWMVAG